MLCDLENEVLDRTAFAQVFQHNLLDPDIAYVVAEWDGKVVGIASCHVQSLLHHAARVGEVQEMYVDPALRSQGVGKKLLEELIRFARDRGAVNLEVTSNQIRLDTHRFYEREEFRCTHYTLVRKL